MKNTKLSLLFTILLSATLVLGACTPKTETMEMPASQEATNAESAPELEPTEEAAPEMMTFTDDTDTTIEFSEYPQAIVSISPSTTETIFAIGAGEQLVGREDMSLYPEEALGIPSVGTLWGELPTETILAMEPDLIVAAQIISEDQVQALRDLGLNVYWQANPTTYEELWQNLRDLAAITGHEEETEALIADLNARVKVVQEKIAPLSYRPTVFYELDATDPSAPWTAGSGTFIDYIISMAGGFNAASELQGDYTQISSEELIAIDPQLILLADALYGVTAEIVAERPGWDVITAVAENAIYSIDPNIMSVPGPRLVNALEETAKIFHPEVFK